MDVKDDPPPRRAAAKRGRPPSGADDAIIAAALGIVKGEGLSHLTTKEVARRAGVSEASVFYHFGDKVSLLRAVVLAGLSPLERFDASHLSDDASEPLERIFADVARAFEEFFDQALPITEAVQGDNELRQEFAQGLVERDLGPHRGVRLLAALFDAMQRSGRVADDFDADAVATLLIGSSFLRAWTRHFGTELSQRLPDPDAVGSAIAHLVDAHRTD